jgi:hypothetical protein
VYLGAPYAFLIKYSYLSKKKKKKKVKKTSVDWMTSITIYTMISSELSMKISLSKEFGQNKTAKSSTSGILRYFS